MGDTLLHILIVLLAAKLSAEVAERIGLPAVVGEILAGVAVGPSVLGLVGTDEVLHTLGELGVILLLLQVGLELDLADLGAVGRSSLLVAVAGVAMPFAAGVAVMRAFGESGNTAIFVGAALTATSVGITARVFGDLRALATKEARTVLGAAVADDVLGLVILTVVVRLVSEGSVSAGAVVGLVAVAVAFLVVTAGVGVRLAPAVFGTVHRLSRSSGTLVALALAFALGVAQLASAARLAPIVGAFVAGLALARCDPAERIRRDLTPVGHLFVPVFFLQIGIDADVSAFARPRVLGVAACLLVVGIAGKVAAGWVAPRSSGDRLLIGIGMIPRGEVGLIFAGLGLAEGVLDADLYGALLLVVLVTTLLTPPVLGHRLRRVHADDAQTAGEAVLQGALVAALAAVDGRPDFTVPLGTGPLPWDADATARFLDVLRHGNARSWRYLEATGVLERALPELADALSRRRADPTELDPLRLHRWSLLEDVHAVAPDAPDALLLAALVVEAADDGDAVAMARRVARRLGLDAAAEEDVVLFASDAGLLRAASRRPDGLDEEQVLKLAVHIQTAARAHGLYVLSLALGPLEPVERARVDALYDVLRSVLAQSAEATPQVRSLAEQRRAVAERLVTEPDVVDRLAHASTAYVLSQDPPAVARQARLVQPLPRRREVRVATGAAGPDRWWVDVASRDRPGLLAAVTGVLAAAGCDVVAAVATTWPDGGAVESFTVRAPVVPDPDTLRQAVVQALRRRPTAVAVADAAVSFDNAGSPWYTLCRVEAPDDYGLLHALTTAFAVAGADVHSARVGTFEGRALDQFELTDGRGGKLDDRMQAAVVAAVTPPSARDGRSAGTAGQRPVAIVADDAVRS